MLLASCFQLSFLGLIWGTGGSELAISGLRRGENILPTLSFEFSFKSWNESFHSSGSYSSLPLEPWNILCSSSHLGLIWVDLGGRVRFVLTTSLVLSQAGEEQASPQETHKEAGQQKPELPPPSGRSEPKPWWWKMRNDVWGCWCIMTNECMMSGTETIFSHLHLHMYPHEVYWDDWDDPSELRFATCSYSIYKARHVVSWLQDRNWRNWSSKSKRQNIDPTSRQSTLNLRRSDLFYKHNTCSKQRPRNMYFPQRVTFR